MAFDVGAQVDLGGSVVATLDATGVATAASAGRRELVPGGITATSSGPGGYVAKLVP